jgi:putative SOS response-associated peptidase YedK
MAEWLDPDNLEESDHIAGEVKYWPVGVEVGNVRNNSAKLAEQVRS